MHQMDLEYEHGAHQQHYNMKKRSQSVRPGVRDGGPVLGGSNMEVGAVERELDKKVRRRDWQQEGTTYPWTRWKMAPLWIWRWRNQSLVSETWWQFSAGERLHLGRDSWQECKKNSGRDVRAWARSAPMMCAHLCVRTRTTAASAEVGVASLCATQSREQVGPGWSRESVLIVFVPLSCLAIVRAASTSWEANCCIYTRRCLPFPSKKIYLFIFILRWEVYKKKTPTTSEDALAESEYEEVLSIYEEVSWLLWWIFYNRKRDSQQNGCSFYV